MNIRHFFDNIDEKTIDRITEKYPPLSSDDKERLYAMSKNKYNSEKKENKNDYSEVMGVERYRKPVWQKVISAVAAAVVVLGGVGGGAALIRRNNDADILKNESSQLAEIEDIAQQLTDEFFDLKNIISSRGAAYDENDVLTYKIGIFDETVENPDIHDRTFYRVTDERFKCSQDIYDALKNITSSKYFPEERYENATIPWEYSWDYENEKEKNLDLFYNLGTDVSMFENGSEVGREYFLDAEGNPMEESPIDFEDDFDWEAPRSIWMADYVEYNGSLYVLTPDYFLNPVGVVYDYNDKIEITDVTNDSFTVIRYADISHNENIIKRAEFKFILENDQWCIDDFSECVLDTEGIGIEETDYTAIATELSDKYLELENIICFGGISYDENEMKSYTVYDSFDEFELIFYKVTDPRFICEQDFYDEIRSIHTNQRYPDDNFTYTTFFAGCSLDSCFGGELSEYAANGRIDLAANYGNGNGYSLLGVYCYYNGELYVTPFDYDYELAEYTSDVIIKETGENSFTATRKFKSQLNSVGDYYKVFEIVLENGEWKIDKAYVSSEESEDVTESEDEYEYLDIAGDLTDRFFYMIDVLGAYNVSYDENDFITYNCYSVSNPATFSEKYGVDLSGAEEKTDFLYTRKLYKVTDDRFKSCQDIYNALRELTSSSLLPEENYENADLPIYGNEWVTTPIAILGTDVSMYESGSNIYDSYFSDFENRKFDMQDSDNWEAALSAFGSHYVEYNGNLYIIGDMGYSDMPDVHVNLQNVEKNRFSVTRKHIISYEDETKKIESYNFDFVFENGKWKIDNVERVVSDEEAIGIAIASYVDTLIRSDTGKYGNIYENPDVFDFGFEIVSYNGENNCTARVILTDYDYVDIIELTAEIDIKEQKVINAEIIELQ